MDDFNERPNIRGRDKNRASVGSGGKKYGLLQMYRRKKNSNRAAHIYEHIGNIKVIIIFGIIFFILVAGFVNQRELFMTFYEFAKGVATTIGHFIKELILNKGPFKFTHDGVYLK